MAVGAARQQERREALRGALARDPLLTDAHLAAHLGVSIATVRLDRMALGIPEVRDRARAVAERSLGRLGGSRLRGEVLDLLPGVSALALLEREACEPGDPGLFADAEALALSVCGIAAGAVEVVNVKFGRATGAQGRLVAKAEVLRRAETAAPARRERRVVLVQIRSGEQTVLRAKFAVAGRADGRGQDRHRRRGHAEDGGQTGDGGRPVRAGAPA